MVTDCWKCKRTISIQWPCNASSFAPVSPAHVRFTEHGSTPSYPPARCPLARRPREWRMRWHLHVSVYSLMTQRSFLSHTLSPSSLLCSLSSSFSGHLFCLLAAELVCLESYPNPGLIIKDSCMCQFPLWLCQKETCLTSVISASWVKLAVHICMTIFLRILVSVVGYVDFSLPRLMSQRW